MMTWQVLVMPLYLIPVSAGLKRKNGKSRSTKHFLFI